MNETQNRASIVFGMGCFWGAEKRMSEISGVLDVESGYAGGDSASTSYQEVLSLEKALHMGMSDERNHAEVIKVIYDPRLVDLETLMIHFWQNHDPTQGDRQGNDVGSNYRSVIYYQQENEKALAEITRERYQQALSQNGYGAITTEIAPLKNYNRAEEYHQDYLQKNPHGYCGLGGTGVLYPD
ncbi:peptide-methionine (S)-S-oxide reductase MsrA [Thiomicrorhabdus xiamenensis]|uniref:Peptide methionine sulfoxide reductase MsrA n=1 Tax=Thiomicrorhabdus xiamenensis TaxID=2739063 RepID=A0A7D4SRK1_9GAMM|nr:peptide-methionine (S)-S-oxide reductase MsrA [Thiomicrorhabdus xiamenensis]QKI88483.1 peptide-methionine (S)-S-oxide reductase MsrA [Thiomicrorhabdus xiamenensis]